MVDEKTREIDELEEELNRVVPVKTILTVIKSKLNYWQGDWLLGERLALQLNDGNIVPGPADWDTKTSDSTWSITYRVRDHILDFSGTSTDRYKYPDWLWYDSDPPKPGPSAIVSIMKRGFLDSFPNGEISAAFYENGCSRLHRHLTEADDIIYQLRKLFDIWPLQTITRGRLESNSSI